MKKLYIITGPAGVGKSTISKKIAQMKEKSVFIEGDEIYSQVVGSYVSAWKEGNHLEIFWEVCLQMIETYLSYGYDVIFNYIVTPSSLAKIKNKFKDISCKFVVLMVEEDTLLSRDKQRPVECQMKERCLVLLNNFKNMHYEKKYYLDTTYLSVSEIVDRIESSDDFVL